MLVQVKNVVALLLSKSDKSDDELRRAERLLDENRLPYGATGGDDRAQAAAAEEAIVLAAKHINSDSDDDNESRDFLIRSTLVS